MIYWLCSRVVRIEEKKIDFASFVDLKRGFPGPKHFTHTAHLHQDQSIPHAVSITIESFKAVSVY